MKETENNINVSLSYRFASDILSCSIINSCYFLCMLSTLKAFPSVVELLLMDFIFSNQSVKQFITGHQST